MSTFTTTTRYVLWLCVVFVHSHVVAVSCCSTFDIAIQNASPEMFRDLHGLLITARLRNDCAVSEVCETFKTACFYIVTWDNKLMFVSPSGNVSYVDSRCVETVPLSYTNLRALAVNLSPFHWDDTFAVDRQIYCDWVFYVQDTWLHGKLSTFDRDFLLRGVYQLMTYNNVTYVARPLPTIANITC